MRVACLGGGPAGLYFAISMKRRDPVARDRRLRAQPRPTTPSAGASCCRTRPSATSPRNDPDSAAPSARDFAYWDDIAVDSPRHASPSRRPRLLRHRPHAAAPHPAGSRPRARRRRCGSRPSSTSRRAPTATTTSSSPPTASTRGSAPLWPTSSSPTSTCAPASTSGSARRQKFDDAFTFIFEETEHGWIWAHAYQFDADTATFIVECSEATWRRFGFDAHEPGGDDRRVRADLREASRRPPPDDQRQRTCAARRGSTSTACCARRGRTRTSC